MEQYILPETLEADIASFESLINDFKAGKAEAVKFKAVRVPMGVYEQRKDGVYMVRIRTTGGVITPAQLLAVIDIAESHHSDLLHITTRQEIQIQNLSLDEVIDVMRSLKAVGLSSKGGGGNTVRNIMVSVDSGLNLPEAFPEAFDPTPHAMALTTMLIAESDSFTLPRKLKIAFANSEANTDFAAVNDIGFVARVVDGQRGFKVYIGGSVASHPTVGWVFREFLPENEIFALVHAVKKFFSEHGNRKNRHKARIRYIFYKLGTEETFSLLERYFDDAVNTNLNKVPNLVKVRDVQNLNKVPNLVKVQDVKVRPFLHGNINLSDKSETERLRALISAAAQYGDDVLRFTPRQNLQIRNVPEEALADHIDANTPLIVNNIVSCTGADTCRLGICLSKGLAAAVRKALLRSSLDLHSLAQLRINISGCPNSCGQQVWADLGFSGKVMRNSRIYPGYQVFAGAARGAKPELAEAVGSIAARDVPTFVVETLKYYLEVKDRHADFHEFILSEGKQFLLRTLEKYKEIPDFEEDKNYYYDYGADNVFSIVERGAAECSAGLFDMIDLDLNYIKSYRLKLEAETNDAVINSLLYQTVYSASRMLLVTRGDEPKTTADVFTLFLRDFIDASLVDARFRPLIELALNAPHGDFIARRSEVMALADAVISLYENMDDSLQFKNVAPPLAPPTAPPLAPSAVPQAEPTAASATVSTAASATHRFKDLRGVACPMNFVLTKLQLSSMKSGETLEIWLDDGQPVKNVPGSVRGEGHEVLEQTQVADYWKVVIRK